MPGKLPLTLLVLMLSVSILRAQSTCPAFVQTSLDTVGNACTGLGRNEACYGNLQIEAQTRISTTFEQVGDTVNIADVESLTLAPFDALSQQWGIALFSLQLNLPDSVPGQNVTVLAFGDIQVENAIDRLEPVSARLTGNGRARLQPVPSGDVGVITSIPVGSVVDVVGRDEANDWLYVRLGVHSRLNQDYGWVSTQVLAVTGDLDALPIIPTVESLAETPPEVPLPPNPMTAFYLRTGVGSLDCAEVPTSGLLLQSPQGEQSVTFNVNGVQVGMASTLYVTSDEGQTLNVYVLEGRGAVTAEGETQFLPAGTFTSVPLADDGRSPVDVPSAPAPYDASLIAPLPVSALNPQAPIEIAQPLPTEAIEQAIIDSFAPHGIFDGIYAISTSFVCDRPGEGRIVDNFEGAVLVTTTENTIDASGLVYSRGGDGRYYWTNTFTMPTGITRDGRQLFDTVTTNYAITIVSPTEMRVTGTSNREYPTYGDIVDGISYATDTMQVMPCTTNQSLVWLAF